MNRLLQFCRWYLARTRVVILAASVAGTLWVLFSPAPLAENRGWGLFVSGIVSLAIVRFGFDRPSGENGFLYSLGVSRNSQWTHLVTGLSVCVLCAWSLPAILVAGGVRSLWLGRVLRNPFYPLMRQADIPEVLLWGASCFWFVPCFLYAAIRDRQPCREVGSGRALVAATLVGAFVLYNAPSAFFAFPAGRVLCAGLPAALAFLFFLFAGRKLHQTMEVR